LNYRTTVCRRDLYGRAARGVKPLLPGDAAGLYSQSRLKEGGKMKRLITAALLLSTAAMADVEIGSDVGLGSTPFCGG